MFSINISSVNPDSLFKCLTSIKESINHYNIEIIINNAIESKEISGIVNEFGFTEIRKKTNILRSRILMAEKSQGETIVILDDTRIVNRDFIMSLEKFDHEIGFIKEEQIGTGIYAQLARLHDDIIANNTSLDPVKKRYVLPRVYRRDLLYHSIDSIESNLSPKVIDEMKALDLEILYLEASKTSRDFGWVQGGILYHDVGDIYTEIKKMYKYGKSTKRLKNTPYAAIGDAGGRMRSLDEIKTHPSVLLYLAVRAFPFFLGYLV